jgi:hypothetical protein
MIPDFNHSHVLPPFLGGDPTIAAECSPYLTTMLELVERFAHLPGRRRLLDGLMLYRADLAKLGFIRGFQWLDGSFSEDVEAHHKRPPNDIDLVTFAYAPLGLSSTAVSQLLASNEDLFITVKAKVKYGCDAYDCNLFSHRRGDHVWKGLLQVPLESDDTQARELLDNVSSGENDADTA